jgi:hypothetical protein
VKRSTLQRKTPLKSSGFKRKSPFTNTADKATAARRTQMKRRVKKPTVEEGSKYLAACAGEDCYLRVFGVCVGRESVVPCHSNQSQHGKGMGLKAKHEFTLPGCWACHAWIDQGKAAREVKFSTWDRGFARWVPVRAAKMGLKEEEGAVLDSNSDAHGLAHAARPQRETVCLGVVSADGSAGNDRVSAGAAESAEHVGPLCLGACVDTGGSARRHPDFG